MERSIAVVLIAVIFLVLVASFVSAVDMPPVGFTPENLPALPGFTAPAETKVQAPAGTNPANAPELPGGAAAQNITKATLQVQETAPSAPANDGTVSQSLPPMTGSPGVTILNAIPLPGGKEAEAITIQNKQVALQVQEVVPSVPANDSITSQPLPPMTGNSGIKILNARLLPGGKEAEAITILNKQATHLFSPLPGLVCFG